MAATPGALRGGLPASPPPFAQSTHQRTRRMTWCNACAFARHPCSPPAHTREHATRAPCTHGRTEPQSASCSIAPEPAAAPAPPPLLLALPFPAEPFCRTSGPSPW
eukprot:4820331-Prymnesium_polylepis.1